jgi:2-keto-4-pentenoate hydratase/2-oxohepta-3-ene-1,7-dioic acid hydratase in catechol pathway
MRLVAFARAVADEDVPSPGILLPRAGLVLDLVALGERIGFGERDAPPPRFLDWLDMDGPWHRFARAAGDPDADLEPDRLPPGATVPVGEVRLLAPVPRPGKIVAVGLNYRDHAAEANLPVPAAPVIFGKFPSAVIGDGAPIVLPAGSRRVDYEGELAVVVGRRARRLTPRDALGAVLGFVPANDVSERDFQKADGQWVRAKSCDTFAPLGPAIVTLDEVSRLAPDGVLRVRTRVNGTLLQDGSTADLVFDVPSLLAFLSETITLEPGDVVLTGTPAGVGFARRPRVFLSPGDLVEVEIGGIGVLRNPVVAEEGPAPAARVSPRPA